jgi:hypothetical protein
VTGLERPLVEILARFLAVVAVVAGIGAAGSEAADDGGPHRSSEAVTEAGLYLFVSL